MPVKLNKTSVIKSRLGIQPGGRVQKFFTNTCAKHMDKYVPMDKGNLADYHIEGTNIVYNQVYARYQYYGKSKNGKDLVYNRDKHNLANSYWDKRMVSAEMVDVQKEVQSFINKGGK